MNINHSTYQKLANQANIDKISKRSDLLLTVIMEKKIKQIIENSIQCCNSKTISSDHIYQAIELDGTFLGKI